MDKKSKEFIGYFLLCIIFFTLLLKNGAHLTGIINTMVKVLSYIFTCAIVIYYIINHKISKITIFFILFLAFLMLSSIVGDNASIKNFIGTYYPILGLFLLLDIMLKKNPKITILGLEKVYFLLILINFFTIILFPDGWYEDSLYTNNWFLEYDNLHILTYLPGLLISGIATQYKKSKINYIYIIMFCTVTYSVFYCFSATSVIAYILYLIYILLKGKINNIKIMNAVTYFIVYIFIFFFIVVFRCQNVFEPLIVDYLGKDLTFTGRTLIWDRVTKYIEEKPILGYGVENSSVFGQKIGSKYFTHAHNTIYDIMYKGGIISLTLFIGMIISAVKILYKNKDEPDAKLTAFILLAFFVMMNFEAREEKIGLYVILLIGYHIESISKSLKSKNNEKYENKVYNKIQSIN